jgi:group I intron endonuclease
VRFKIYLIENTINGKVYVGKTKKLIEERWKDHVRNAKNKTNRRLYDAMNKYGPENFTISELDSTEDEEKINEIESWFIHILHSNNPNHGYNMTLGGDGGNTISAFTEDRLLDYKKKLSESIKGYKHSEKTKLRLSEMKTGIIMDDSIKEKISKTIKDRIISGEFTPNTSGLIKGQKIGFKHTDSSKEKISKKRSGKKYEEIYGDELAKDLKRKKSENWKGEKNPNFKNICKEDLYEMLINGTSTKDLALKYNVTEQTIINKSKKFFNNNPEEIRKYGKKTRIDQKD